MISLSRQDRRSNLRLLLFVRFPEFGTLIPNRLNQVKTRNVKEYKLNAEILVYIRSKVNVCTYTDRKPYNRIMILSICLMLRYDL